MRLFIGLPFPAELRLELASQLAPWRARYPGLKWVDSSQFHFTLQFLGEADRDRLLPLIAALGTLSAVSDFRLETGRPFGLPQGPRARVLALGLLSGVKSLRELAGRVQEATSPLGFPPEDREFKAHLTLARVRRGERMGLDPALMGRLQLRSFQAHAFHLYESKLTPAGPIYTSLLMVKLGRG